MVFLDYASTNQFTKYPCSERYYNWNFNPNANYAFNEKKLIQECEERVKKAIGAKGGKVVFGGTASQLIENLMNYGRLFKETIEERTSIIGSALEHNSVYRFLTVNDIKTFAELEDELAFCKKIGMEHPIVCWMAVNNVVGNVFDVEVIGKLCHKYNAFYICDMTAAIGHMPIKTDIDGWCDCAFWSGHKIGTDLGIGSMWLSEDFNDWLGDFKLYGTPNVAGALCIADATEDVVSNINERLKLYDELLISLTHELSKNNIDFKLISNGIKTSAINAIRFNGINARALQSYLASKQIYVGLGQSSCAEKNDSRILCNGYNLSKEEADEVVRISFGENSSRNDVLGLVEYVKKFVEEYV